MFCGSSCVWLSNYVLFVFKYLIKCDIYVFI